MKKLFEISSEERNRILEMHQTSTKKNYLSEQETPPKQKQYDVGRTAGDVTKLSKLKGKQDLVDKLISFGIGTPEEMFATLKKYGIEPQKNSKFNMSNSDDVNLMGDIYTAIQSMNHVFLRNTTDEKVVQFCKSNTVNSSNMCTTQGIMTNFQPVTPKLSNNMSYDIKRFSSSRCPLLAMIQDRFGYLPNDTTVSGKFNYLISEKIKSLVSASGYQC